jgi:hypothetical protein
MRPTAPPAGASFETRLRRSSGRGGGAIPPACSALKQSAVTLLRWLVVDSARAPISKSPAIESKPSTTKSKSGATKNQIRRNKIQMSFASANRAFSKGCDDFLGKNDLSRRLLAKELHGRVIKPAHISSEASAIVIANGL